MVTSSCRFPSGCPAGFRVYSLGFNAVPRSATHQLPVEVLEADDACHVGLLVHQASRQQALQEGPAPASHQPWHHEAGPWACPRPGLSGTVTGAGQGSRAMTHNTTAAHSSSVPAGSGLSVLDTPAAPHLYFPSHRKSQRLARDAAWKAASPHASALRTRASRCSASLHAAAHTHSPGCGPVAAGSMQAQSVLLGSGAWRAQRSARLLPKGGASGAHRRTLGPPDGGPATRQLPAGASALPLTGHCSARARTPIC